MRIMPNLLMMGRVRFSVPDDIKPLPDLQIVPREPEIIQEQPKLPLLPPPLLPNKIEWPRIPGEITPFPDKQTPFKN